MALTITLEDERGVRKDVVFDTEGILDYLVFETIDKNSNCPRILDFLDPYGNTVFNIRHMGRLEQELEELRSFAKRPEDKEVLSRIISLVEKYKKAHHWYIKIVGD